MTEQQRKAALDAMPDMVGTPDTAAYKRSNELLQGWYCRNYKTIREALQAPQPECVTLTVHDLMQVFKVQEQSGYITPDNMKRCLQAIANLSPFYPNGIRIVKEKNNDQ